MASHVESSTAQSIARSFRRLGWLGFWVQAVLAILPIAMIGYLAFGRGTEARLVFGFLDYVAILGLGILLFTTLWSYRYARLGRRLADPEKAPSWSRVVKALWVGIWAGCIGIVISVALMLIEVVRLLILFMKAPQGGVPVIRTETDNRTDWVSAMDVVSLLAELCTLIGELVVVGFALWLLFKVLRQVDAAPPDNTRAGDAPAAA